MENKITSQNFRYNQGLKWYETNVDVDGRQIRLILVGEPTIEDNLNLCNNFIEWFYSNHEIVKKYAAEKLINLKNESWNKPNEENVTVKEFIQKWI